MGIAGPIESALNEVDWGVKSAGDAARTRPPLASRPPELDKVVDELKRKEKVDGHRKTE
jgi:hypothetical protein